MDHENQSGRQRFFRKKKRLQFFVTLLLILYFKERAKIARITFHTSVFKDFARIVVGGILILNGVGMVSEKNPVIAQRKVQIRFRLNGPIPPFFRIAS